MIWICAQVLDLEMKFWAECLFGAVKSLRVTFRATCFCNPLRSGRSQQKYRIGLRGKNWIIDFLAPQPMQRVFNKHKMYSKQPR